MTNNISSTSSNDRSYQTMNELIMILTTRCNQKCVFCCEPPGEPDVNTQQAIKWLEQIYEAGIPWVDFSGGEPLLHPDVVQIIEASRKIGLRNTLSSNGILIPRYIGRLFQYVDQWNVSLHGLEHTHNQITNNPTSHQKILKSCELLASKEATIHVTYVVTPANINDVRQSILDLYNAGVKKICFNYVFRRGQGSDYINTYEISQEEAVLSVHKVIESMPIMNMTIYHNINLDGQCALIRSTGDIWAVPMSNNIDYEKVFSIDDIIENAENYPYLMNHRQFTYPRLGPVISSKKQFQMKHIGRRNIH